MKQHGTNLPLRIFKTFLFCSVCMFSAWRGNAQSIANISKQGIIFSAVKGMPTKPNTVTVPIKNGEPPLSRAVEAQGYSINVGS
jgi:hypothetical protein